MGKAIKKHIRTIARALFVVTWLLLFVSFLRATVGPILY
jgi:hypothetical protein